MLYGLPTRERGALADKNRYIPWNGAAMSGRMELTDGPRSWYWSATRYTAARPWGRFYAAYAGTATQEGMTGQNAGERLTGCPAPCLSAARLSGRTPCPLIRMPN